jgi:hypothetical protein
MSDRNIGAAILAAFCALGMAREAAASSAGQPATVKQTKVVAVDLWRKTGLTLHAGDVVTISAEGRWNWSGSVPNFGPDGDPTTIDIFDQFGYVDAFDYGRLLGYIGPDPYQDHYGDKTYFPQTSGYLSVGSGKTFVAPYGGELWLGLNDDATSEFTADNQGRLKVTISVGGTDTTGPVIAINSPASVYARSQSVTADYSCTDPDATITSCSASVADGGAVDTNKAGQHAFTVVATDTHGNRSSLTTGYFVAPNTHTASLIPLGHAFAPQYVGTVSAAQQFTLVNPSDRAMRIDQVYTNAEGDFNVAENDCGKTLAGHGSCNITVTYGSTAPGTAIGALNVESNFTVQNTKLLGFGTLVEMSPSSLAFAGQSIGTTSAPISVTLSNDQSFALKIYDIDASGDFAVDPSGTCGGVLPIGHHCTVAVTFTPTAQGARSGGLVVHANAQTFPLSVALSGTGTP